ncbi:Dihydrolipoyllysine-residue acetyltransferase component 1 of pyruvate dehydrogenase complex [Blattella germanica]|nr:Dihydrolipoyllysine-residue acetyltransferase component 1 of pyruvate dehydrogenase complex [Blattella germanica]
MAAAIRVRIGNLTKNYVQGLLFQSNALKTKHRICFHNTAFLNVVGQELKMPSLSPTMTEGTIVKWLKKEGDPIQPGDVLCDIQTDKAVVSFETEEEGILAKILIGEDAKDIKIGTVIALMVPEGEDWKSVEVPSSSGAPPSGSSAPSSEVPRPTGSGSSFLFLLSCNILNINWIAYLNSMILASFVVVGQELKMPSLSPTMSEGTIVKWMKKEGDPIAAGDVLCDIQTDKAVMSFETEEEGTLAKILVKEDTKDVKVGTVIALMVAEGEDWKNVEMPAGAPAPSAPSAPSAPASAPSAAAKPAAAAAKLKNYGPAVHFLLDLYKLQSSQVTATGKNGKLLKADVLKYVTDNKLTPKPPKEVGPPVVAKASPKAAASATTTIPHAYGVADCKIDNLLAFRKQLKEDGIKVSVNDFVIKAVALALQQCPQVNALQKGEQLRLMYLWQISNLGMFGVDEFSAIINPPQCGILAIGTGRLVLDDDKKPVTKMKITLSYDGRAIDEEIASEFLDAVKEMLEDPAVMLLGGQRGVREKLGV